MNLACGTVGSLKECIEDILETIGSGVIQTEPLQWRFKLADPSLSKAVARFEGTFLLLDAPLDDKNLEQSITPESLWRMLKCNSGSPPWVKFTFDGRQKSVRLRADVPLSEDQKVFSARVLGAPGSGEIRPCWAEALISMGRAIRC